MFELFGVGVICFDVDIDSILYFCCYSWKVFCSCLVFEILFVYKENYVNSVGGCLVVFIGDCFYFIFLDKF